jgi:hypothetical protein
VTDVAAPLEPRAGHERVHRLEVRLEVGEPVDQAVAIAKAHLRRDRAAQQRPPALGVGLGPGGEPGVHDRDGIDSAIVGDQVGEERQLVAPALDMVIPRRRLREFMAQRQPGAGGDLLELDRHPRSAGRHRRARGEADGVDQPPRRLDRQHLARCLGAARETKLDPAAGPRIDRRPLAPPAGPARRVGEVRKDDVARRAHDHRPVESVVELGHGRCLRGRGRGRGPRRPASSSACSRSL